MPAQIIPFPQELRPQLPTIVGNVDYLTLRQRLEQIDALLRDSGVERQFVQRALERWNAAAARAVTALEQLKFQQRSRRALRCTILRTLLQEDYRGFSCQLAGNPLYQWFCLIDALDQVRVPSKSELQRLAHWLPAGEMREVLDGLLKGAVEQPRKLGLKEALALEEYFLDSTCLKANIHFPTDWVLLRDGVRTLMKATLLIRKAGLRGRMIPVGSGNLIRPQIVNLQLLAAEPLRPVFPLLALSNAAGEIIWQAQDITRGIFQRQNGQRHSLGTRIINSPRTSSRTTTMRLAYIKGYPATRPGRKRATQYLSQLALRITVGKAIATGCLTCQSLLEWQFARYRIQKPPLPLAWGISAPMGL